MSDFSDAHLLNDADSHNNQGLELLRQGKPDEAVAEFCRAIELRPNFLGAYMNIAATFRNA